MPSHFDIIKVRGHFCIRSLFMKNKMVRSSKRYFSLFLSFLLVFCLIGCSPSNAQPDVTDTEIQPSPDSEEVISDAEILGKIDDNGKPIYDFDEFVNGEWRSKYVGSDSHLSTENEMYDLYFSRMKDILVTTDLSTLDEESGLFKVITLYNEMCDISDASDRMETIRKYYNCIEQVNSLGDLYSLLSSDIYTNNDYVFRFEVIPNYYGLNSLYYQPKRLTEFVNSLKTVLDDPNDDQGELYRTFFQDLGYSEERVEEIINNGLKIGALVDSYLDDLSEWYVYWDAEILSESGVDVPVFSILNGIQNLENSNYFYADEDLPKFLNEVYTSENLDALKDCLLIGSTWVMFYSGCEQYFEDDIYDTSDDYVHFLLYYAPDVMSVEYMKRYGSDDLLKDINSLILDIKKAEISIVSDSEWLEDSTKECIKQKMSRMTQYIGENGHKFLLGDFAFTGDTILDLIELKSLYCSFERGQLVFEGSNRAPFGNGIIDANAIYSPRYNSLVVYPPYICDPLYTESDTYEERLAILGFILAHEIGHSIDRSGIEFDWEGLNESFLSDSEIEAYNSMMQSVSDYLDGLKCEYDKPIPGDTKLNETVADLIAMETCLRVLADREEADYDLFFRTYARMKREYYPEDSFDIYLNDTHLTSKPRINFILAQFDEFYETYDIDESSPYFVPEDQRLRIF